MWKSRKFIMILALAIIALVGGTTGAVMAASSDDGTETQAETQREALRDRVCEIYEENTGVALDPDQLQSAFEQARQELRLEAMEERLQELVDEGKITQEEADEYLAWLQSRPDVDLHGLLGFGFEGGMMGGRVHHNWDGNPYCGDSSDDTSEDATDETTA